VHGWWEGTFPQYPLSRTRWYPNIPQGGKFPNPWALLPLGYLQTLVPREKKKKKKKKKKKNPQPMGFTPTSLLQNFGSDEKYINK
jgi:hypothetical protein